MSNGRDEGWAPCSYLEGDKDEETITNIGNEVMNWLHTQVTVISTL